VDSGFTLRPGGGSGRTLAGNEAFLKENGCKPHVQQSQFKFSLIAQRLFYLLKKK